MARFEKTPSARAAPALDAGLTMAVFAFFTWVLELPCSIE